MPKFILCRGYSVDFNRGIARRNRDFIEYHFKYRAKGIEWDGPGRDNVPDYVTKFITTNAADLIGI